MKVGKNKSLIIIFITLLLLIAIAFFLIWPVASSIWASWQTLGQARKDLTTLAEKKQVIEGLKNIPNLNKVAEIAQKYIPEDPQSGELVLELSAMAGANRLTVEQITLEKPADSAKSGEESATGKPQGTPTPTPSSTGPSTGGAKTADFLMKLTGDFTDFMNFLKTLETSSRLISLKNLSMQTKQEGTTNVFSVQLTGAAYYKPDVSLEKNLSNIKISSDTLNKFLNLKTYGEPILPTESDFGRTNPFETY